METDWEDGKPIDKMRRRRDFASLSSEATTFSRESAASSGDDGKDDDSEVGSEVTVPLCVLVRVHVFKNGHARSLDLACRRVEICGVLTSSCSQVDGSNYSESIADSESQFDEDSGTDEEDEDEDDPGDDGRAAFLERTSSEGQEATGSAVSNSSARTSSEGAGSLSPPTSAYAASAGSLSKQSSAASATPTAPVAQGRGE